MGKIVLYGREALVNSPGPYTFPSLEFQLSSENNPVLSNGNVKALKLVSALASIRNQRNGNGFIIYDTNCELVFDKSNFLNNTFQANGANQDRLLIFSKGQFVSDLDLTFPVFDVNGGSFKINLFGSDNGAAQTVGDTLIFQYTIVFEEILN